MAGAIGGYMDCVVCANINNRRFSTDILIKFIAFGSLVCTLSRRSELSKFSIMNERNIEAWKVKHWEVESLIAWLST